MPYKDPAKARARDRQCYRRLTEERIALGLCPKCGQASPTPNHSLCQRCGEKRRKAERARYAAGKTAGKLYGGCDAERCRRIARDRSRRRDQARKAAGLCTRCGRHPPVEGGTVCEPCREARRESEREQYAEWRAAGECGRCGAPVPDGGSRCERCARCEAKRSRKNAKNAQNRQRYARRRARRLCTDCGELSRGASRCPACARVSVSPAGRRHTYGRPAAVCFQPRRASHSAAIQTGRPGTAAQTVIAGGPSSPARTDAATVTAPRPIPVAQATTGRTTPRRSATAPPSASSAARIGAA